MGKEGVPRAVEAVCSKSVLFEVKECLVSSLQILLLLPSFFVVEERKMT